MHIQGIYWYSDGCVAAIPRRKNTQHLLTLVVFADTGKANSVFKTLRAHYETVAGCSMPVEGRCTTADRFVFRGIKHAVPAVGVKPGGHTWSTKRVDALETDSIRPINRATYKKSLEHFKDALQQCCSMTRVAVKEFGLHSMRMGGDTWLF